MQCRAAQSSATTAAGLRKIWAVSDIHTDYEQNLRWVHSLEDRGFSEADVLLLAGDASDDLRVLEQTLTSLRNTFGKVFFLPGNHELWLQGGPDNPRNGGARDSYEKLQLIFQLCTDLGIQTRPERLADVWIVPLQSWHHRSWDREPEVKGLSTGAAMMAIKDYTACKWPPWIPGSSKTGSLQLAEWFDSLNDGVRDEAQRSGCDVISMSHFLPHQELMPEKRFLYFSHLAKVAGSDPLAARVAALRPDVHIFGHTHFSWNMHMSGTRYIQAPLAYPSERQRRLPSLSFGAAGNSDSAATAPPPWLPVLVYEAVASSGPAADAGSLRGTSAAADAAAAAGGSAAADGSGSARQPKHGRLCAEGLQAHWSEYYKRNARDPSNTELAPWVERRRRRRKQ